MINNPVEKDIVIRTQAQGPISMDFINNQLPSKQLNLPPQKELNLVYGGQIDGKNIVIRTETHGPISMDFINNQPPSKQLNLPPQRELNLVYGGQIDGIFDYTFDITFE